MHRLIPSFLIGLLALAGVGGYALAQNSAPSSSKIVLSSSSGQSSSQVTDSTSTDSGINSCQIPLLPGLANSATSSVPGSTIPSMPCKSYIRGCENLTEAANGCLHSFFGQAFFGMIQSLLSKIAHVEVVINLNGSWQTYDADQGAITSVTTTSLSIKRLDGVSLSFTISSNTNYFGIQQASLANGQTVVVVSQNSNALFVIDLNSLFNTAPPECKPPLMCPQEVPPESSTTEPSTATSSTVPLPCKPPKCYY